MTTISSGSSTAGSSHVLRGNIALREGVQRLKHDIHAFSRRLLTWWRRDREIRWIKNQRSALKRLHRFLK